MYNKTISGYIYLTAERTDSYMKIQSQILVALGLGAKRNWHIFFAIIAGAIVGALFPAANHPTVNEIFTFAGQVFIRLIQMVVIPLVVSAIIVGIASLGDGKQLGKIGLKMVLYYAFVTIAAVIIGAVLGGIFSPGTNLEGYISPQQAMEAQQQFNATAAAQKENITNMYLNMIPSNPIHSLANGDMVPIIIFVFILGCALAVIGEINRPVVSFFESIFASTMKITDWIMVLAMPGIFALTAASVSNYGLSVFGDISKFLILIFVGFILQLTVVYPLLVKLFSKLNIWSIYRASAEAMMVAFGTASSSATLPVTIACCERRVGISNKICSFVLPLGATMNMDATALFQTICVIFLTQAYGIQLDFLTIVMVCLFAIVASSTCAGIPGAALITIALVLKILGLTPEQLVQGFAILFTIDRIVDMTRTMLNVTSDIVVASVIADNENEIDRELLSNQETWKEVV